MLFSLHVTRHRGAQKDPRRPKNKMTKKTDERRAREENMSKTDEKGASEEVLGKTDHRGRASMRENLGKKDES